MKVKDLREALSTYPDNAEVFFNSDDFLCEISGVNSSRMSDLDGADIIDVVYEAEWLEAKGSKQYLQALYDYDDIIIDEYRSLVKESAPIASVILS